MAAIPRRLMLVTGAVVAVEIAASLGAAAVTAHERGALLSQGHESEARQIIKGRGVLHWTPSASGFAGWATGNGAVGSVARSDPQAGQGVVEVSTTKQPYAFQLVGPTLTLPPGDYQLFVDGAVRRAGIALLALDPESDVIIASRAYSPGPNGPNGYGLKFNLAAQRTIRLVLANNGLSGLWTLRSIEFGHATTGNVFDNIASSQECSAYRPVTPHASSAVAPSSTFQAIHLITSWNHAALYRSWRAQVGARAALERTAFVLRTSGLPYGYQLASPVESLSGGDYVLKVTGV